MTFTYTLSEPARRLHYDAIIFDGHSDSMLDILAGERAWDKDDGKGQMDLPRLRAGGITAQIFAAFVEPSLRHDAPGQTMRVLETMRQVLDDWPADMLLATRAGDVRRAKAEGRVAAILSMEGAEGVRTDLTLLRAFYRLGIRNMGLTHNDRNLVADGVGEGRTAGGLTEFGVKLVAEMRRLGIMVDVAHLAPAGVAQVFEVYDGPVVVSHGNAKSVCNHRRNLTDAQLEQLARSGGVIGVTYVPSFIAPDRADATLEKLLDHVDHIVKVIGIEHVGLGSDWDGIGDPLSPAFPQHVGDTPAITEGLLRRGYREADIRKFLGENWLRVFAKVCGE